MECYIDKYLVFPETRKYLKQNDQDLGIVHVIDHSNSPRKIIKVSQQNVLTCHDLIYARQWEGSSAPKTSASGKKLQNWIQQSLPYAESPVIEQTKMDLNRIFPTSKGNQSDYLGTEPNPTTISKQSNSNKVVI